jgi:4-diphosphocytidyl-2-C-methyl-D-erythritol kinase
VWRAATSFFRRWTAAEHGAHIRLAKCIPVQAGLGGGSSDAAATLLALNDLFGRPLSHEELVSIAAELGSDIAFFLRGGTALMQGRGEQGHDLPDAPELNIVVVKPHGGVPTSEAYRALDAHPDAMRAAHTEAVVEAIQRGDRQGLVGAMGNHFECVIGMLCPDAVRAMGMLNGLGALCARLCGSGSAVFGMAESQQEADRIADALRADFEGVWVCRTVGRGEVREG